MRLVVVPVVIAVALAVKCAAAGFLPLVAPARRGRRHRRRRDPALRSRDDEGLLSVVAVLSSLYPIVIVVLARVLLAERIARPQLAGVAVALTGVALISAA